MLGSNSVYPKSLTKTEKDIGRTSPPSCSPQILNSAFRQQWDTPGLPHGFWGFELGSLLVHSKPLCLLN